MAVNSWGVEVLSRGVPLAGIGGVGFSTLPNLVTDHAICELCSPSERGLNMEMNMADPASGWSYSGTLFQLRQRLNLL